MRTKNFSVATTLLQKPINIFGGIISVLVLPLDFAERLGSYVWRMVEMTLVASLLGTDYKSAAYIIYMYKGMEVFPDDSTDEEEVEEDEEGFDDEDDEVIHPPIPADILARTASQISVKETAYVDVDKVKAVERAFDIYVDFTYSLYESLNDEVPLVKPNGQLVRNTKSPWTKAGLDASGDPMPEPIKRMMREIIDNTSPAMYIYDKQSTTWCLNIEDYPTFEDCRLEVLRLSRLGILD